MNFPSRYKYQKKYFPPNPKIENFWRKPCYFRLRKTDRLFYSNQENSHISKIICWSFPTNQLSSNFETPNKQEELNKKIFQSLFVSFSFHLRFQIL